MQIALKLPRLVPALSILIAALCAPLARAAQPVANAVTLCTADETILFSCQTTNNHVISLCSSKAPSESTGYIQYRYGAPAKIELVYPSARTAPAGKFNKEFQNWARGSYESSLSFVIGQYTYTVYANWIIGSTESVNEDTSGTYGNHAGVRVERQDEWTKEISCDEEGVSNNDPRDFDAVLPDFLKRR